MKRGSYRALRNYLEVEYAQWRDNTLKHGKPHHKFAIYSSWNIGTIKLED